MAGHLKVDSSQNYALPLHSDRSLNEVIEIPARQPVPLHHGLEHEKPYFGLPEDVVFCGQCVISNQRPNSAVEYKHRKDTAKETIKFDRSGTCDACNASERKNHIDWSNREKELIELCDRHRRSDGRYDCLVPGSGKDSCCSQT